jgi:hypothetical protein
MKKVGVGRKVLVLSSVLACGLTMLTARASEAQTIPGSIGSRAQEVPTALATPAPPFAKFNVFASGAFTQAAGVCPDVTCASSSCSACTTFSGLPAKGGLAGAKLSGELIFESGYNYGQCYQVHGITTATATSYVVNFIVAGQACIGQSVDDIQFTGNYVVSGGTGAYAASTGTGSFTTVIPNAFGTVTQSLAMSGTFQKAK